ncbi:hypothetical protein CRENBAI_014988 [Crenichthys baileyi]|uniref:Uncharacterized protein n=1 Tax=Crenichthys baileyi TaxID=28760 RepID=A0AAV9R633_9TELE
MGHTNRSEAAIQSAPPGPLTTISRMDEWSRGSNWHPTSYKDEPRHPSCHLITLTGLLCQQAKMNYWPVGTVHSAQQSQQRHPDFCLPRPLLQPFWGEPKDFPSHPGDIARPGCSGPSPGTPPGGTRLKQPPK